VSVDEHDPRHLVGDTERSQKIDDGRAGGHIEDDAAIGCAGWQIPGERGEELDFDVQTSGTVTVSGPR
jgi:hypothetical protein